MKYWQETARTRGFFWFCVGLLVVASVIIGGSVWGQQIVHKAVVQAYVQGWAEGRRTCCCGEAKDAPAVDFVEGEEELARK